VGQAVFHAPVALLVLRHQQMRIERAERAVAAATNAQRTQCLAQSAATNDYSILVTPGPEEFSTRTNGANGKVVLSQAFNLVERDEREQTVFHLSFPQPAVQDSGTLPLDRPVRQAGPPDHLSRTTFRLKGLHRFSPKSHGASKGVLVAHRVTPGTFHDR
jgi:hypothetical protein